MMAILDILIYVAFAFFASSLAKKSENYIEDNDIAPTHWDKYLTYFVLFFTFICGIRWNVGSDNISYTYIFAYREYPVDYKEPLWRLLVHSIRMLGLHWSFGLATCAFLQFYFITKTLQQYRWLLIFIPFVLFGGRYWMECVGAIRQMMVACGFLWAMKFIYERRLIPYLAFVFVGSLIHQSAVILIVCYFIPIKLDLTDKRWPLILILLGCVILGNVASFTGLANYVQLVAGSMEYDRYGEMMSEMLLSGYDDEALKIGPMMISYILIPIFIIWYGAELKEKYGEVIPYFDLWYNLAFFYACMYFLVCNLGHIFIRPIMYFSPVQMIMATMVLQYLWTEYRRYGIRQSAAIAFCCVIAINSVWNIYKVSSRSFESVTYKVFIFHKDQLKWFNL